MNLPSRVILLTVCTLGLVVPLAGAQASDPVYPKGSRVGIVPLEGIVPIPNAPGFENPSNKLTVTVTEVPPATFEAIDAAMKEGKPLPAMMEGAQNFKATAGRAYLSRAGGPNSGPNNQRVAILVSDGKISAFVAVDVPSTAAATYPEQAVRMMLASTSFRPEVPAEEQLDMLPFKVSELSGFKTVRTLVPGQAVMLMDGEEDAVLAGAPYVVVSIARVSADQPDSRERLAREMARTIPGLATGRIVNSEPMRISGTAGFETRVEGTSVKDATPVNVVQWLRFGGGATLRIIAGASKDNWQESFTRFRAVRDGVDRK